MEAQEVTLLMQSMLVKSQIEIVEIATVNGDAATALRQGQTVETKEFPAAIGLNLATGERVILLRPGGDLNAALIIAKITGQGLAAKTADSATSATTATNANASDKVDGIDFRNNSGTLEWSDDDGSTWQPT